MKAYLVLKMMIKYQKKSKEEILAYMDAYLAAGKISQEQYNDLISFIQYE